MIPSAHASRAAEPIRVAFVLHVMQVAGAEMLVFETIRRLGARIRPTVFCLDQIGQLGETLQQSGVDLVCFHRKPGRDWGVSRRMAAAIRQRDIEVIHAHQYTPFFYSSIAAIMSRRKPNVIFTEHGRHYPDVVSAKRRLVNRLVLGRLADEITAVCEFSAKSLADNDSFPRRRIAVIPNGIDLDRYSAVDDRPHLRARLGLAMDRQYIVIVARFHPVKDHATLLRAFATLADQRTGVDLLLVGDGPLRQALERQIDELNIRPRVHLLGVRSDVADLLRASDIFVLSSVSEAASITLLESKACGLPAVVTDVGGNPELVRDHVDGLLVPRGDAERLAQALLSLADRPDLRHAMGTAAATDVADRFRIQTTIERYQRLYERNAPTSGI